MSNQVLFCLELQKAIALGNLRQRIDLKQTGLGFLGLLLIRDGKLRTCSPKDQPNNRQQASADA